MVIITVRKNVILEAVQHVTRHHKSKRPVLVVSMISKCSPATRNLEKVALILFLFVECLVAKSYNVAIRALEAATREPVLIAK